MPGESNGWLRAIADKLSSQIIKSWLDSDSTHAGTLLPVLVMGAVQDQAIDRLAGGSISGFNATSGG
ncbi:MAG: hypothetical protein HC769_22355 [Cyanobacteria bacterium CRU_2_1]|nr:hypothetical protein [Cyanobacteria bacterium RU_5_0]NJR61332.1 hypothetical protein [Cyanobacteria bacterium CRU_2_1]